MIWRAFVDTDLGTDSKTCTVVDALKDAIEIVPKHSKDIGIQMHHPGKVGDDMVSSDSIAKDVIEVDTSEYVKRNWHKYVNLANEMISTNRE